MNNFASQKKFCFSVKAKPLSRIRIQSWRDKQDSHYEAASIHRIFNSQTKSDVYVNILPFNTFLSGMFPHSSLVK